MCIANANLTGQAATPACRRLEPCGRCRKQADLAASLMSANVLAAPERLSEIGRRPAKRAPSGAARSIHL